MVKTVDCSSAISYHIEFQTFWETFLVAAGKTKSFGYLYLLNKVFSIFTP